MMNHIVKRVGNFTSSEIWTLTTKNKKGDDFGAQGLTYIDEKNMERRHGLSLNTDSDSRPTSWGKLLEGRCFDLLGLEYDLVSDVTLDHPTISYWKGSPDATKERDGIKTVVDIKCPMTRKSFSQLVDPLHTALDGFEAMQIIRDKHKDGEKYYWQLVSNAILTGAEYAELIVYMPYFSELPAIKELASDVDHPNQSQFYWINYAGLLELPHLRDGGYYQNVNVIRFQVLESDKKYLTECVLKAGKLLIEYPKPIAP